MNNIIAKNILFVFVFISLHVIAFSWISTWFRRPTIFEKSMFWFFLIMAYTALPYILNTNILIGTISIAIILLCIDTLNRLRIIKLSVSGPRSDVLKPNQRIVVLVSIVVFTGLLVLYNNTLIRNELEY
jgi:hypothetical protein